MKIRSSVHRGMTLTELIVGLLLVSVLATAVMVLFRTSWLSYQNLVWQSKVNMEARRTLDDICDSLRKGGFDGDLTAPRYVNPQFNIATPITAAFLPPVGNEIYYRTATVNGQKYLLRRQIGGFRKVGQHISLVEFEYEYRLPATSETDTAWQSIRVSTPDTDAMYLAHTVYVTVTAEVAPFGNGGATYRRKMTSAVHLRGPYNTRVPRAKYMP
jgi:prepilin-type N-terminal cleavage/methylation domain-containing protein